MAISKIEELYQCIDKKENFILDAGAGSGKTWSLIESLKYIINKESETLNRNNQKIVCITYTNVAKNEIIERLENNKLVVVSTIHDFLWSCISQFKKELKEKLIEILDEKILKVQETLDKSTSKKGITYDKNLLKKSKLESEKSDLIETSNLIEYKNYPLFKYNIVSHDEIIDLSMRIFSSYPVITKLITDAYPTIFVDEYQDTFPEVIKILLNYLLPTNKILFGFFGDKMQKIYDKGIGEIPFSYELKRITKSENYRCSKSVINLLNKIRDDITQFPAGTNKEVTGSCSFYQANENNFSLNEFIKNKLQDKLNLDDSNSTLKILHLTHKLIARENGYEELYTLVNGAGKSDALTKKDEERCPFIKFLYQIEEIITLYQNNQIQELLRKISFEIDSFKDKNILKSVLDELILLRETKKNEDIYNFVIEKNLLQKSEKIKNFDLEDEKNKDYFDSLFRIEYKQIRKANTVAEEQTPFSTQHGTKGSEFENVLVVIDDTAWRNYSYDKYFSDDMSKETIYDRSRNLFYVVCSRAENNLVVLALSQISQGSKDKINDYFDEVIDLNIGEENAN